MVGHPTKANYLLPLPTTGTCELKLMKLKVHVLFLGEKLIIPQEMRQDVLNCIHESHLGMEKCKSRARAVVYWPGMSAAIERMISKCSVCLKYQRENQKEPSLPHEVPQRPWQKLGADIFELNSKSYLLVVDSWFCYNWYEIYVCPAWNSR